MIKVASLRSLTHSLGQRDLKINVNADKPVRSTEHHSDTEQKNLHRLHPSEVDPRTEYVPTNNTSGMLAI